MEINQSSVQCKFFSKEFPLPGDPIRIPSHLKRYGLSEVIGHLLPSDIPRRPFDFLINGHLLRSSLEEYLSLNGISLENTLNIEVISSIIPPETLPSLDNKDNEWLSCVDRLAIGSDRRVSLWSCFDGSIRYYSSSASSKSEKTRILKHSESVADGALMPVKCLSGGVIGDGIPVALSGGVDGRALIWNLDSEKIVAQCEHESSVESALFIHNDPQSGEQYFITGCYDEAVRLWSVGLDTVMNSKPSAQTKEPSKKRLKMEVSTVTAQLSPLSIFTGHLGAVTSLAKTLDKNVFLSAGMDNSIRVWNLESTLPRQTILPSSYAACLSVSPLDQSNSLFLSGHSDRLIRFWDIRTPTKSTNFSGHSRWVSSVCWSPESMFHFVSASYDGTLRFWDIRSSNSIYTVRPQSCASVGEESKIFSVKWMPDCNEIIYGGQSGKFNTLSFAHPETTVGK